MADYPVVPAWGDPESKISKWFSVHEALWLPSWQRYATESDGLNWQVKSAIIQFAVNVMDPARELLGVPLVIHCWYRPLAYNKYIGGAENSAHQCLGNWGAADFSGYLPGSDSRWESCNKMRALLIADLVRLNARMENAPDTSWVHLDNHPISATRYFKP